MSPAIFGMIKRGGQTITWDVENRPVEVSSEAGTGSFVYDGNGNRVKKVEGNETTIYVNRYYEKNLTAGVVTSYYYLGDRMVALKKDTTLRYVHQDHLSGTAVITDVNGSEVGSIKYYPYGETRSTGGTLETDKKFTGQRLDDTGLYYYGARYYDPTIGRFISPDTLVPNPANPQAFNRYSYCLNNPLRYIDPTGLLTMEQLAASGVHSNDRGMTKELWDLLVAADPGDTIIWTNPEKTSVREYRIISMDQAWQRIGSVYYNRTEIQGEGVWYFGPINKEGFILHEIGAGKTMQIGELDSSNLRGDMTLTRDTYSPGTDTIYREEVKNESGNTYKYHNPNESAWDKMQSGWSGWGKSFIGGSLIIGAGIIEALCLWEFGLPGLIAPAPLVVPLFDLGMGYLSQGMSELGVPWIWPVLGIQ